MITGPTINIAKGNTCEYHCEFRCSTSDANQVVRILHPSSKTSEYYRALYQPYERYDSP